MLELLKMPLGTILLLLFIVVVLFNVVAKLLVEFICSFFKGKGK